MGAIMSTKTEVKVVRILYVVLLVLASLILVSPFFIPIVFGGTLSLALYPLLLKLESKGMKRNRAAGLITFLFTVIISIPVFFFVIKGTMVVTQALQNIAKNEKLKEQGVEEIVSTLRDDLVTGIHKYLTKFEFMDFMTAEKISHYLDSINGFLLNFFQSFASSIPLFMLFLLIIVICIFSFLKNAFYVRNFFQKILGVDDEKMNTLIKIYIRDSRQVYLSNIVTGGIQSFMVSLGVWLLGIGDFFLVFFITLILSFIPVVGAGPVALVFAFIAFVKGMSTAAIILVVLSGVVGVTDNILRPWLTSFGESKCPPVVSFVFVIGGALLLGFPGLFIGLLVGSYAYDTLPIFWNSLLGKDEK